MKLSDLLIRDPEKFKEECRQRERRTTIAYFGVDLIIDRQGDIHCIELNGQNSGTKGFSEAYGEDFARKKTIDFLASFGLPVTIYNYNGGKKKDRWAEETLGVRVCDIEKIRLEASKEAMSKMTGGRSAISDDDYYEFRGHLSPTELALLNYFFSPIFEEKFGLR